MIRGTPSPGSSRCTAARCLKARKNPDTLEYSARWGIEPMFSDFKSRGFGIEDTQLRYADRLILALYVAVSTGQAVHCPTPSEKKVPRTNRRRSPEAELPGLPEDSAASPS
jgi:hypothetical protein